MENPPGVSLNTEPAVRTAIKLSFVIWIVSQFPPEPLVGTKKKKKRDSMRTVLSLDV